MCESSIPSGHIRDYRPEVRSLLRALKSAGLVVRSFNNGDANMPVAGLAESALLDEVMGADDCKLGVVCPDGKCRALWLVFGNSPGELVADYVTGCALLESVISSEGDKWESQKQPTRFCQFQADRDAFNARAAAAAKRGADCSVPLADRLANQGGAK